jgi:tRNA (guanine37-N1)-methyltransferase
MRIQIITLFPEMCQTALKTGLIGKAIDNKIISLDCINPRDFAIDKYQSVDDHPYGGGPGLIMMAGPLKAALKAAKAASGEQTKTIYLSPQGKLFDQTAAAEMAKCPSLIFLAGRYEGVDERIIEQDINEEWSIGDYILTGGELAALVMIDAIVRLVPGVVGNENSIHQDSLTSGVLKYPQYTRPEEIEGSRVPPILLSGHHQHIERWRLKASLGKTWLRRPDLLTKKDLTPVEKQLLAEFIEEFEKIHSKKG